MINVRALADLLSSESTLSDEELRGATAEMDDRLAAAVIAVRARMDRLRSRDRELSALMSSARELVGVRDLLSLLQRLVDRAHDLVGTEITYLSEYIPDTDELFVRATRGAVSPRMESLRVPAGMGLASRIVHTRAPQWTDYAAETDLPRDPVIDAAIAEEHMQSILGVPMISDDQVLGVLFAADRYAHAFSADQIALLSAFAGHAAVILQTVRLLDAERRATLEAERATADARARAAAMEAAAAVHEDLTRLVLAGEGPAALAETLHHALGRPVAIADQSRTVIAVSGAISRQAGSRVADEVAAALDHSRSTGHWADVAGVEDVAGVVAAVAGRTLLGALLVGYPGASGTLLRDDLQRRTTERTAQILALLTMQENAVVDAEERVRGELVADLLSESSNRATMLRRASARGIDLDRPWVATSVAIDDDEVRRAAVRSLQRHEPGWLVGQAAPGLVVLIPEDEPAGVASSVRRRVATVTEAPLLVVAAARAVPADEVAEEVRTVAACARMLPSLGIADGAVDVEDFAPYLAMFGNDATHARAFARRTLAPLLDWDEAHGTALTETVEHYLLENRSITRAARALFVHPSTVKLRLERVGQLLGPDWREGEHQFRLGIATRLRRLGADLS